MLAPFQDAQRAMRLIRARAPDLGLDPSQIGIIGYSAGGHCAGMVSVEPDADWYTPVDTFDDQSARPDFTGLIYPVLTMLPPNRTRISTLTLLGSDPSLELSATWSVDLHVTDDTPTTFLAQATDDPIAPVENSLLMFSALRKAHVPVEMHVFRSGGHGLQSRPTRYGRPCLAAALRDVGGVCEAVTLVRTRRRERGQVVAIAVRA